MALIALVSFMILCTIVQGSGIDQRCLFACTADYKPVCGNDLITYPNECALRGAACKQSKAIIVVYRGKCLPKPNQCRMICTREYLPVCGSDGRKYPNECTMRSSACGSDKAITVVSRFAFEHTDCGSEKACFIPCTRDYRPLCGSDGQTHSNECEMRVKSCMKRTAIVKIYNGACLC